MGKPKNDIDKLIKEALGEEEASYYEQLEEEQTLMQEWMETYKGKKAWLSIYITFVMIALLVGSIYCLVMFFQVVETKELMIWGGGFFLGMISITALKVWAWMQMDRNAMIREVKRLEFQVNALVKGLNNG